MEIYKQGESVSLGFSLPIDYDLNRIELIEVFLGSKKLTHTITDNVVSCQIPSENTRFLSGVYKIMFTLDDSIMGVKPLYCDSITFNASGSSTHNNSVNTGFDLLFPLIITETAISIDVPLYELMRGADGADGVGIDSITLILTVGLVKTYRILFTDSTTFDYTVTDGEKGDVADQQYSVEFSKTNLSWVNGWFFCSHFENLTHNRLIKNVSLVADFGHGSVILDPILNYPSKLLYNSANTFGFYFRDTNSLLRKDVDFDNVIIKYDVEILTDDSYRFDSLKQSLGNNVVFNDVDVNHSNAMSVIFSQIYTTFGNQKYIAMSDPLTNYATLSRYYKNTYLGIKDANIIVNPIGYNGTEMNIASLPDSLTISSHSDNNFGRRDNGFTSAETFFKNTILVGSRIDDIATMAGTSYGYGMEFFEDQAKTAIDYTDFHPEVWSPFYQQSNACAIVAAKLRMIKDATNSNWNLVRLAARATAKKTVGGQFLAGQAWDMYRGYGIIQVSDAIAYIESNYKDATSRAILADQLEAAKGISPFLKYADLLPNSPISKKLADEQLATKENAGVAADLINNLNLGTASQNDTGDFAPALTTDENYVSDAEKLQLHGHDFVTETENKYLRDDNTFQTIPTPISSHSGLTGKNDELAYQHIDQTTEKATPIDADSVAIWDSVALKFVRNKLSDLKTFLGFTFAKLSGATFTGAITATNLTNTNNGNEVYIGSVTPSGVEEIWIDPTSADVTTADIADSVDKRYQTDFQLANKFGSGANYAQFDSAGNLKLYGTATQFEDITFDAMNLQQSGSGVSRNTAELTVDFTTAANNSDFLFVNIQLPHARKLLSAIYPHIHWNQAQNAIPNWAIQYRWQVNGGAKVTAWTALKMNTNAITYVSGTINQISMTSAITPSVDALSDILQFKIVRDTNNQLGLAFAADPYTATASVLQFDIHVEKDSLGSNTQYVK